MKRNRMSWADVTCYGAYVMYEHSTRKWKDYDDIRGGASSHARFKTLNRARKNALALHTRFGCKVVLLHWSINKGVRMVKEYTIWRSK